MILAPILNNDRIKPKVIDYLFLGNLFLGKCVPNDCTSAALKKRFLWDLEETVLNLAKAAKRVRLDLIVLSQYVKKTIRIHCEREDDKERKEGHEVMGTMLFIFLFSILFSTFFEHSRKD
jgi:hypothetical protein